MTALKKHTFYIPLWVQKEANPVFSHSICVGVSKTSTKSVYEQMRRWWVCLSEHNCQCCFLLQTLKKHKHTHNFSLCFRTLSTMEMNSRNPYFPAAFRSLPDHFSQRPSCSELQWRGVQPWLFYSHSFYLHVYSFWPLASLQTTQLWRSASITAEVTGTDNKQTKNKFLFHPFFSFGAKPLNGTRLASYLVREWCGSWISGGLVVKSREEEPCSACMSCQQIC